MSTVMAAGSMERRVERSWVRGVIVTVTVHLALALTWWFFPPWSTARSLMSPTRVLSVTVIDAPRPLASPTADLTPRRVLEPKPHFAQVPEVPRADVGITAATPNQAIQVLAAASSATVPASNIPKVSDAGERPIEERPPDPKPVSISQVSYLTPPVMAYPLASRRAQEQGRVEVRVLVDTDGLPQSMAVVKPSGYPRLDEAALATVRATRFRPYRENGVPRAFWVVMPLIFELDA